MKNEQHQKNIRCGCIGRMRLSVIRTGSTIDILVKTIKFFNLCANYVWWLRVVSLIDAWLENTHIAIE